MTESDFKPEYLKAEAEMLLRHPVLNLAIATMTEEATEALIMVKPEDTMLVSRLQQRIQVAQGLLEELQSLVLAQAENEVSIFYEEGLERTGD